MYLQQKREHGSHWSHAKAGGVRGQQSAAHSSRVVTLVEFGQEVGAAGLLALVEVAHDVGLLLPHVDGFLELHFALWDGRHRDVALSVMTGPLTVW